MLLTIRTGAITSIKKTIRGSQDRDVIDTKDGQIARTLLINGKPLTPSSAPTMKLRMKKLVEDPGERAKRDKRAKEDEEKGTQMFKAFPDAFIFKYEGAENGQIRLSFFPNPHYNAPTRELQVFRSMSGMAWIDRDCASHLSAGWLAV